ncbi:MAG: UbiA family prenyltransferase [Candidatus Hodarchaeales archaeon]|jgi:geranylgeranylglycerol-phosphate geranylgeranyltransferase
MSVTIQQKNVPKPFSVTLKGFFKILRPYNSLLAGLATVIGILISIGIDQVESYALEIFLAALATALIAAGGYVINDYYDYEIDQINQPKRPLPSEEVSLRQAKIFAFFLFSIGFIVTVLIIFVLKGSILSKLLTPFLGLFGILCLYSYAAYFKRVGGLGNLIIVLLVDIPFVYGGVITGHFVHSVYPIIVGSCLMLGREIIKDIEDIEGDRNGSSQISTLPMVIGINKAVRLSQGILLFLIICSPIAFLVAEMSIFHSWGLFICVFTVDILTFVAISNLRGKESEIITKATFSKRLLKSSMAVGVIGLLIASLTPFSQLTGLI